MIKKNQSGQRWRCFAFNRTNNLPVVGDAPNITAKIQVSDEGSRVDTNDVNPEEAEDGFCDFLLTQAETNADELYLYPESSTPNVQVIPLPAVQYPETGLVGAGADDIPITINDSGGDPLANVQVWITTSVGGVVVAGTLLTNSAGQVTFQLDAGTTYYVYAQKDQYNSLQGTSFTAATAGHAFSMAAASGNTTIGKLADVKTLLGGESVLTAAQLATLTIVFRKAESAAKNYLRYNPAYRAYTTHFYPKFDTTATVREQVMTSNASGTKAYPEVTSGGSHELQLEHVPIRDVESIEINYDGRAGSGSGTWTLLVEGTDYYVDWESAGYCRTGIIYRIGNVWPTTPGDIRITYTAGFTDDELNGLGSIMPDAATLREAVNLATIRAFHQAIAWQKKQGAGFATGAIISENLGDYSYTLDSALLAEAAGMRVSLPNEVLQELQPFRHYGFLTV